MKKHFLLWLLALALLVGGAYLPEAYARADAFEGFDLIIIGDDDSAADSAEAGDGLVLTLGEAQVLDSWNGESDPHFVYVAVAANLMNWTTETVNIAESVTASLTFEGEYAFAGFPEFSLESLGMLERLDGQLVFKVPLFAAVSENGALELTASAQGQEVYQTLDLADAAASIPASASIPFDFDAPQGDALEIAPGEAIVREAWNGQREEVARWLVQPLRIINWSDSAVALDANALTGSLAYMDKYAFQGTVAFGQASIEPLEIVDATLAIRVPTVATEAKAGETELWLDAKGFEYREALDMAAAVQAGEARDAALRDKYAPGTVVAFGSYEQANDGGDGEPIEWIVLDWQGNQALLLSRYALDVQMYSGDNSEITWEGSGLRAWMNGEFLQAAFTEDELKMVLTATLDNSTEQGFYDTDGGNATEDQVFAPSYAELTALLPENADRICEPTGWARARGAHVSDGHVIWFTRSPGESRARVMRVDCDGSINPWNNSNEGYNNICVRPAILLDLDAFDAARQ